MSKRKLVWARSINNLAMTAAPDGEWADLLGQFRTMMGTTANLPGTTVMRIRFDVFAANLAAGSHPFYVGIRRGTMKEAAELIADPAYAFAASAASDLHADWMMWRALFPNHGADPTTGVPNATTVEMDVRSMRKLDEPQDTLLLSTAKATSTAGFTALCATSVLLALP